MKSTKTLILASTALALFVSSSFAEEAAKTAASTAEAAPATAADKKVDDKAGAKPLSLKISGNMMAIGGAVSQKVNANGKSGAPSFMVPVSDLNFIVGGQTANGYGYGYVARLQTITKKVDIKRSYLQFSGSFGVLQLGNVKGPDDTMSNRGMYSVLGGTNGIDGSVPEFYNFSAGVLKGADLIGSSGTATKLTFTSPDVHGLKFGVSYTPNTNHLGKFTRDNTTPGVNCDGNDASIYLNEKDVPYGYNNLTFGLSFDKDFGTDWKLNLSAVAITEKGRYVFGQVLSLANGESVASRQIFNTQRSRSYILSGQVTYKDWDVAASFADNGKSRMPTQLMETTAQSTVASGSAKYSTVGYFANYAGDNLYQGNAGKAWNVGSRYTFGSYQAALGYFRTDRKTSAIGKASMNAVTATLDLKALEGLVFFGEVTALQTKTNDTMVSAVTNYNSLAGNGDSAIGKNKGAVFILGTKASF